MQLQQDLRIIKPKWISKVRINKTRLWTPDIMPLRDPRPDIRYQDIKFGVQLWP